MCLQLLKDFPLTLSSLLFDYRKSQHARLARDSECLSAANIRAITNIKASLLAQQRYRIFPNPKGIRSAHPLKR